MTDALILSSGLDTNGQNGRYGDAARKYGDHPKVIDALAIGKVDPGGVVGRLQEASVNHPEVGLRIRSAHKQDQYFMFPGDLRWGHDAPREERVQVKVLARNADVIHLNNSDRALYELGMRRTDKAILLHHHGSLFRSNPQRMLDTARAHKMVQAVSTIDLQSPAPDILHWLPTAYDIAALAAFGKANRNRRSDIIRIGHFPTNRAGKKTDLFVQVMKELMAEGLPVEFYPAQLEEPDWLPRWDWQMTMASKASCDIVFDQLMYGYGCNAVEAWGMGIPVISGGDDWTTRRMKQLWGQLPYEHVTERTLKAVIRKMVQSRTMRDDVAQRGVAHALRWHDELPALEILASLYREAMDVRHKPRIAGKGVTFRSSRHKVMTVDGQAVDFTKGDVVVTDEIVVRNLRLKAKTRPGFGIEEVA